MTGDCILEVELAREKQMTHHERLAVSNCTGSLT